MDVDTTILWALAIVALVLSVIDLARTWRAAPLVTIAVVALSLALTLYWWP